jgi:hypothetical protein
LHGVKVFLPIDFGFSRLILRDLAAPFRETKISNLAAGKRSRHSVREK